MRRALLVAGALCGLLLLPVGGGAQSTLEAPTNVAATPGDTSLTVSWTAPASDGGSAITAYDVRYIRNDAPDRGDDSWTLREAVWSSGALEYEITGLTRDTYYDVQVRAVNADGAGPWSAEITEATSDHPDLRDEALAISLASPVTGHIAAGDSDWFSITLTEAMDIWVHSTSQLDMFAELFDSDGVSLAESGDSRRLENNRDFALHASLEAGTYYLEVTHPADAVSGATSGAYTFEAAEVTAPGDSIETALPITLDARLPVRFHKRGDSHYFTFELTEAADVWIMTYSKIDLVAYLSDSEGAVLETSDDGRLRGDELAPLILRSLSAGKYSLRIRPYYWNRYGPYTLYVRTISDHGNTTATASPIQLNGLAGGIFTSSSDVDYFRLELSRPIWVRLYAIVSPDEPTLTLTVFNSDGEEVQLHRTPEHPWYSFQASGRLPQGTYDLRITSDHARLVRYVLHAPVHDSQERLLRECEAFGHDYQDSHYGCQWHLNNSGQFDGAGHDIGVETAWETTLGADVNVAIVDTGLAYEHPDLRDNVVTSRNHSYYNDTVFTSDAGHGTAVAGLVAARDNEAGVRGVAPRASIHAFDLIWGYATDAQKADAAVRHLEATHISNNSWGFADSGAPASPAAVWEAAIERGLREGAGGKGISYVWAAGNGARHSDDSNLDGRANHYGVIAACAVNIDDTRSWFSEKGANLWVCAPSGGDDDHRGITTTNLEWYRDDFSGTSASTPIVSGVIALMRSAAPNLTWREVKLILAATARQNDADNAGWEDGALQYGSTTERYSFNHEYGFGVVDAAAAVAKALEWDALPDLLSLREITGTSSTGPLTIPDYPDGGPATTVTSTLDVDNFVSFAEFIEINIDFDHESVRDLEIDLVSPSGSVSQLMRRGTAFASFFWFVFPSPAELDENFRLGSARHLGENPAGAWTLRVTDHRAEHGGTINSWSVTAYGHGQSPHRPEISSVQKGTKSLTVAWTAPDETGGFDVDRYDLRYIRSDLPDKSSANWTTHTDIWTAGEFSYEVTGLLAGREYDLQVRASNEKGIGPWSDVVIGAPLPGVPDIPVIESVAPRNLGLVVAWNAPFDGGAAISRYEMRIVRSEDASDADPPWNTFNNVGKVQADGTYRYRATGLVNLVSYDVELRARNRLGASGWSDGQSQTPNVNSEPEFSSSETGARTVSEDTAVGSDVGAPFTATDPDGDALTYSVVGSLGPFTLDTATGQLQVGPGLDYEQATSHTITLQVTDERDRERDSDKSVDDSIDVTITVEDVNEGFEIIGPDTIERPEDAGTRLASYSAVDPEGVTLEWSLGGTDRQRFWMSSGGGWLWFLRQLDFENPRDADKDNLYEVTVIASDGVNQASLDVAVGVTDADEPPSIAGSRRPRIEENGGLQVARYTATDPEDEKITWETPVGTDSGKFELVDGNLRFLEEPDFDAPGDANGDNIYEVRLRASDGSHEATLSVRVTVTDVNEPPIISGPSTIDFAENGTGDVGRYTKSDPEKKTTNWAERGQTAPLTGDDANAFDFDQATGRLTFVTPPDYEGGGGRYEVTLNANDGEHDTALDIIVNVANIEETGSLTLGAQRGVNGVPLEATRTDPDIVVTETWKWQRSSRTSGPWADIASTDARSYTPGPDDVNRYLRAHVTYTDERGAEQAVLTARTSYPTVNDASANQPPAAPDPLPEVGDVPENARPGRNVVRVVFTDPENESLTYSLESDEFAIQSSTARSPSSGGRSSTTRRPRAIRSSFVPLIRSGSKPRPR